jgi:hypothetical protein
MRDVALKRLIACVSLVVAATTAAVPATTSPAAKAAPKAAPNAAHAATKPVAKAAPKCKVAPADEYFGKLKMSILGIRNTIRDQGLKVDYEPAKAETTFNAMALTEDAIHDWQRKYPCDGWLPGTVFALEHYWTKIHTADGVKHVHATFAWLRRDWSKNKMVAVAQREDASASIAAPIAVAPGGAAPTAAPAPAGGPATGPPVTGPPAPPTPFPGTAPQSVINAQSPAPTPAAH